MAGKSVSLVCLYWNQFNLYCLPFLLMSSNYGNITIVTISYVWVAYIWWNENNYGKSQPHD